MLRARRGSPEKKSVSPRYGLLVKKRMRDQGHERPRTFSRYWSRSATASRSLSARTGSYRPSRDLAVILLELSLQMTWKCRVVPPQHEELQMPISTVGAEGCRRQRGWAGPSESCRGSCLGGRSQVGVDLQMVPRLGPKLWFFWKMTCGRRECFRQGSDASARDGRVQGGRCTVAYVMR